jgi:signal transduction histidine kinase
VTSEPAAELKVEIAPDLQVNAHQQVLVQIILNLVNNAVKFRKPDEKPQVRLSAERRDEFVRLTITDNGIGIAPQHRERIWQVFERLHDRETYPGSGIGLAIVKRAVGRMQGLCGVDSEIGKGSSFWIELPVASEKQAGGK